MNNYQEFIEQIFEFQNICQEQSIKILLGYQDQELLCKFNSTKDKGLDDIQQIKYNQDTFGGVNQREEKERKLFQKVYFNDIKKHIYPLLALMIPIYQIFLGNNKNQNEEQYQYKCICAILIIKILYETFIEIYIVRMSYRHLRNEDDQKVQVIRDKIQFIQQSELVVGDILLFSAGDTLPVDGILIEGTSVIVDESYYTLNKYHLLKLPFQEKYKFEDYYKYYCNPFLMSGTKCINGTGKMLVIAVGNNKLQSKLYLKNQQQKSVQLSSNLFLFNQKVFLPNLIIFMMMIFIIILTFIQQVFQKNQDSDIFDLGQSLRNFQLLRQIIYLLGSFYFTIPLILPLYLVLLLTYFQHNYFPQKNLEFHDEITIDKIAQIKKIIIQDPNVLYINQQLKVKTIYIDLNQLQVDSNINLKDHFDPTLIQLITKCIFCSQFTIPLKDSQTNLWNCNNDQIEQALMEFSSQLEQEYDYSIQDEQIILQKLHLKKLYISSVYQNKLNGKFRLFAKGNALRILKLCQNYLSSTGQLLELNENQKQNIENQITQNNKQSSVTIALAYKDLIDEPYVLGDLEAEEFDLTFICLIQIQYKINNIQLEVINYFKENDISVVLSNDAKYGQVENIIKMLYNQTNEHIQLPVTEESVPDTLPSERNQYCPYSAFMRNGNFEQIIMTIKQSKKFQLCFKSLISIDLQNKLTILNLIFFNFINIGNVPYNIFQIVYLSIIFDVFIPLIVILKCYFSEIQEKTDESFENDEIFKNSTITNHIFSTLLTQFTNYLFCKLVLPDWNINSQSFQYTIFYIQSLAVQVLKAITLNLYSNSKWSKLKSLLFSISFMFINFLILISCAEIMQLYPIQVKSHILVLFAFITFALVIQFFIELYLMNFKHNRLKYNILETIYDRVNQLTSIIEQKSFQEIQEIQVKREQIVKIIQNIDLEQQQIEFQSKLREQKEQFIKERLQKEEELRRLKQEEEEKRRIELEEKRRIEMEEKKKLELEEKRRLELEEKKRLELEEKRRLELEEKEKRKIENLQQELQKIQSNQNISENKKQYKRAMISQKLIVSMLEQNQAFKIEKPQVTDLEIKDNNNSSNKGVQLNENLLLYVLKEALPTNVELVKTTECVGGLDSLITGQNNDQSCLRLKVNDNINEPNFDKSKYIKNLKSQISKKFQVEAEKVEILECFEENNNRIDFKIEGIDRELTKEETQFFQQVCNANVEHFKYFQQANEKYQQGNKALIGLSTKDFNPKFNMTWKNFIRESEERGPSKHRYSYFFPKTCLGYGLQVSNKYETDNWLKMDGNPDEWRILYHGTQQDFIVAIAKNGLQAGKRQAYKDSICRFTNQRVGEGIYFSDKIEVCRSYCQPITIDRKNIIVYFMSRVRPSAIRQSVEMQRINYFVVNNSKDIRPYRILLEEV